MGQAGSGSQNPCCRRLHKVIVVCNAVHSSNLNRLAFDTIALCAFNHRFNDFYSEEVHPFAREMADHLIEAGRRAVRTQLERNVRYFSDKKYWENVHGMHKVCDEIIEERVNNPQPEINDLLNVMLNTEDPDTHEKLDKENIRYQMGTFLVRRTARKAELY